MGSSLNRLLRAAICIAALGASVPDATAQDGKRVFLPTSAWLVGPASLRALASQEQTPCVMANQFDNGYNIRISGTDESIMAMAVDFRKQLFDAGESYDLKLRAGNYNENVKGMAHDGATLIINTNNSKDLHTAMASAEELGITFGNTSLPFSLAGVREGIGRLSSCYNKTRAADDAGSKSRTNEADRQRKVADIEAMLAAEGGMRVEEHGSGGKQAGAENVEPNNTLTEISNMTDEQQDDNNDVADMVGDVLKKAENKKLDIGNVNTVAKSFPDDAPVRKTPAAINENTFQWQARQGADLKQVLNIWTSHRNIALLWGLDGTYALPRTFFYEGPIEEAVSALLNEFNGVARKPVGKLYHDEQQDRMFLLVQGAPQE